MYIVWCTTLTLCGINAVRARAHTAHIRHNKPSSFIIISIYVYELIWWFCDLPYVVD